MELYIDLLQKGKIFKYKIFLGIVFIILGIIYPFSKVYSSQPLVFTDWIFSVGFILFGIILTFQGIGKPLESRLGKAYISINKNNIYVKKSLLNKEVIYSWNGIDSIHFEKNSILFNGEEIISDLKDISLDELLKLKETITAIALEKGIEIA